MTKSQKAKAKLTAYITYEGEEATTNNISYLLARAAVRVNQPEKLTEDFKLEVTDLTWNWACDIFLEDK